MAEEKKKRSFKEFMEQMYGVKISDPTPEELADTRRFLEVLRKRSQEGKGLLDGLEDTLPPKE